ncbi:UNVERIFIED_CONTAM: hypothetical protein Slati_4273600 [Sesamum latifolium]|uniref:Retrotransposon gag domain-containing protein n=1 Tax=Sesamum latifolium TaxID=2727402 RepID=A0AAW2TCS5_9LAMI
MSNQLSRTLLSAGERRNTSKSRYGRAGPCRASVGPIHPCGLCMQRGSRTPTPDIWQSLKKKMVELRQQVAKETLPTERGIPLSKHIMMEELPAHFRAPSHLPAYDGTTDPAEHIRKFENAILLHRYTDSIKYRVFLTTLTNSTQQWLDQLPAGLVRSFTEFRSLFQHQFASSKKYQKSVISLFGVKQEDNETLKAYVQRFNTTILEVPTAH